MRDCKNCRNEIMDKDLYECPNCGAVFCGKCRENTKSICPYCYGTLEIKG